MSSKEILEIFLNNNNEDLTIEDIITITFNKYKNKKNNSSIYNIDDFTPQNLI